MIEKINFKNKQGLNLVGVLHTPETKTDKIVIFVHGYRSTKESSKAVSMSKILPVKGIAFLHFDFSGRGESEGKFIDTKISQYVDDLKSAVDYVESLGYAKIGIVGNSLGGLVSLQETAKDKRVKCLVVQSPVSYFPWRKDQEFAPERIKKWKEKGVTTTESSRFGLMKIGYQFYEDGLQFNNYSVYENIKVPVLVLHGTEDESVNIEFSKELIKHLDNHKLIVLEGADHGYTKKQDYNKVIEETINFLEENL